MDGDLYVILIGDLQTGVDSGRRRAPILVQLQTARAGKNLLGQRPRARHVSFSQEAEIHRPGAWRASGGIGSRRRPCSAAEHGGGPVRKRFVDLLRGDEMDMVVDRAGGDDAVFAGDHFGGRPHNQFGSTPAMMSGLPALPTFTMRPLRIPISPLTMPQ
jgi:hypothetical protein